MKTPLTIAAAAVAALVAGAAAAPAWAALTANSSTTTASGAAASTAVMDDDDYYLGADWDDDDDDRRRYGRLVTPDTGALRRAGIVRVTKVERDDGRIEVEGYDARGREIEVRMDARGQRVLSVRRDRWSDRDDRWHDDDRWDD